MTVTVDFDTRKVSAYFSALALRTSREWPVFVRGQAISLVSKIEKEIKKTTKRLKSIRKIYSHLDRMKKGKGIRLHKKAIERAELRHGSFFRISKRGDLLDSKDGDPRGIRLNRQQLRVKYEMGLRRSGVGATRAGWIAALQAIDTRRGLGISENQFSKRFSNPKSPQAWAMGVTAGKYNFVANFEEDSLKNPAMQKAIQSGINKTGNDMEKHFYKKTQQILGGF